MISDARRGHVSPGTYTDEKNVTYSVQSLGITNVGLVGETIYGPAFQDVEIENWEEYVDYFGGTSTEKFKGNGLPKYGLPYIAKDYLSEGKKLHVVRVLGLSGYDAGPVWAITSDEKPVIILRSKMVYGASDGNLCEPTNDIPTAIVTSVTVTEYTPMTYTSECAASATTVSATTDVNKFGLTVETTEAKGYNKTYHYNVSLNSYDSDYIYNVLSSDPSTGSTPIYIEAVYENSWKGVSAITTGAVESLSAVTVDSADSASTLNLRNFKEEYRPAQTPWIVSDVAATSGTNVSATMHKLFKFVTISDGDASNFQVKVSLQNINPSEGTFDVVVRDFNDSDYNPLVLERFTKCSLVEGETSYIAYKIGTTDGTFVSKSKYIAVEMADGEDYSNSIPAGFLGYPMPKYSEKQIDVTYETVFNTSIKAKRQYFGLNEKVIDTDILKYKGADIYQKGELPKYITNGFHMDSVISKYEVENIYVDGTSGYSFTTVSIDKVGSEEYIPRLINAPYMDGTIYKDINARKFTVYFYGGFDGWDINREQRTNTDEFKASKYIVGSASTYGSLTENGLNELLNLPNTAITSDYYAYLAGYRVFANPNDIQINIFATPGINWYDNALLTDDVITIIEDAEEGRGGDALYVMESPRDLSVDEVCDAFNDSDIKSSYACTYFPWILYYDKSNKRYIELPPTKDVIRNFAKTDNENYPWFATAGKSRGQVDCEKCKIKLTLSDEDSLYENCINPLRTFGKDGVNIWGNKTALNEETPVNRVNARRLLIRVKDLVKQVSDNLIFDQYDDTLEKQFRSAITPILADVKSKRGIYDYRIKVENTAETRDQHILPAVIMIKPTSTLEWVSISFVVYPESVEFDEN